MVLHAPDGWKQESVWPILSYFTSRVGVTVPDEDVYFFDDRSSNVLGFRGTAWNARQVSCMSRDGPVGLC